MDLVAQLRGVAEARGATWAERVWPRAHRADRSRPWPTDAKARGLALRQVVDLGATAEALVEYVLVGAGRRWEELRITRDPPKR